MLSLLFHVDVVGIFGWFYSLFSIRLHFHCNCKFLPPLFRPFATRLILRSFFYYYFLRFLWKNSMIMENFVFTIFPVFNTVHPHSKVIFSHTQKMTPKTAKVKHMNQKKNNREGEKILLAKWLTLYQTNRIFSVNHARPFACCLLLLLFS